MTTTQPTKTRSSACARAWLAAALCAGSLGTAPSTGIANCWPDDALQGRAGVVAQAAFPLAAARLPTVLLCSGDEFGPSVGGDYNDGMHRIRVRYRPMGTAELDALLAHELGHAEVALSGRQAGPEGHGLAWVQAMRAAGWEQEVQRVAMNNVATAQALEQPAPAYAPRQGRDETEAPAYRPGVGWVVAAPQGRWMPVCQVVQRPARWFVAGRWVHGWQAYEQCQWQWVR